MSSYYGGLGLNVSPKNKQGPSFVTTRGKYKQLQTPLEWDWPYQKRWLIWTKAILTAAHIALGATILFAFVPDYNQDDGIDFKENFHRVYDYPGSMVFLRAVYEARNDVVVVVNSTATVALDSFIPSAIMNNFREVYLPIWFHTAVMTCIFFFIEAFSLAIQLALLVTRTAVFESYMYVGRNPIRWIGYACGAGFMTVLIFITSFESNIWLLVYVGLLTAMCNMFGLITELLVPSRAGRPDLGVRVPFYGPDESHGDKYILSKDSESFEEKQLMRPPTGGMMLFFTYALGFLCIVPPFIQLFIGLAKSQATADIPDIVWASLVYLAVSYGLFTVPQLLYYFQPSWVPFRYYTMDIIYDMLSAVVKLGLGAFVGFWNAYYILDLESSV